MIHLYYAAVGADSAKALAKRIEECGATLTLHRQRDGDFPRRGDDLCVNWGATCRSEGRWLNRRVFHNKLRQLEMLAQADVPTVRWAYERGNGIWYARRLAHRDGDDLEQKLRVGDFYVQHVDTAREYRAHIFRGEVLRFSLKVPSERFLEPGEKIMETFRTGNGWVFSDANHKDRVSEAMRRAAVSAVHALRYDFGGVDIAYKTDGSPVVFEVNSAPWLGGEMQRSYAKRIVSLA